MNESDVSPWNMTSTNSKEEWGESIEVKLLPLAMVVVMSAVATASNLLVLVILLCKPAIRKNYRIEFILWQCLSDIVVAITGWLFVFNYIIRDLSTNTHYCSLMYHFIGAGIGQSIAHTFLICIDRYMAVVNNIRYKQFNKKYRYMVIFGTWLFIHGYVGTLVIICMRVEYITYCSLVAFPRYRAFLNGCSFITLPFLVAIPCTYIYILFIFKKQSNRTHNCPDTVVSMIIPGSSSHEDDKQSRERNAIRRNYEKQVTVTTGVILLTLLIFIGPFIIVVLFLEAMDIIAINRSTRIFVTMMTLCNCTVNPFLYVWRIRKFRQVLHNIFCPCKNPRAA